MHHLHQNRNDLLKLAKLAGLSITLTIDELKDNIGAGCHTECSGARGKGFLPMSVANYLELLD